MLVLRRKTGEALVINGAVTVTVLAVEGKRVKLGVIAPEQVVVVRGELIDAERQRAHLRHKREELAKETDPRRRAELEQSIARLEQSMRLMQPPIAPAPTEPQEEEGASSGGMPAREATRSAHRRAKKNTKGSGLPPAR